MATKIQKMVDLGNDELALVVTSVGAGATADEIQGTGASGAAAVGNPVGVGGVYNTPALPTLTAGQRGDLQLDANGNLRVAVAARVAGGADGLSNGAIVALTQGPTVTTTGPLSVAPVKFNGTTHDRDRKPNGAKRLPSALGTTNADFAKASAGDLWCISGFNASAAVKYIKFYNLATAPTVGTTPIVLTLALPVGSFNVNMGGHYFSTGIAYALTGLAADADTTALTAADIVGLTLTYA